MVLLEGPDPHLELDVPDGLEADHALEHALGEEGAVVGDVGGGAEEAGGGKVHGLVVGSGRRG